MTLVVPTASAVLRVLSMLRSWFRDHGYAPSYREIAEFASVKLSRIGRCLDKLQLEGFLTHQHGVPRSIVMVDRFANASDDELERACRGRNWTIVKPPTIAAPIGKIYPVVGGVTDWGADLLAELDDKA